jgi:three-Cys-motif partner protein
MAPNNGDEMRNRGDDEGTMMGDFFGKKRDWSRYKDFILGYYLEPYVPKVNTLKRPILVVDCFAGRGTFDDGQPGSPVIIASTIEKWRAKGVPIRGLFIEADPTNYRHLAEVLARYGEHAETRPGTFVEHLPEIAALARHNTVFLYVDPYNVRGLVFDRMKAVYDQIRTSSSSVEVLLNFNSATFMRWALAALQRHQDIPAETADEPLDQLEDASGNPVELATLDAIAGGDYWRAIALDPALDFPRKLDRLASEYMGRMLSSFRFVACCAIKAKYHHRVPKYHLIYATRNQDGLELINDAMCKARREFLGAEFTKGTLFDLTPEEDLPDLSELRKSLLALVPEETHVSRKALRLKGLLAHFGRHEVKDYNAAIGDLLNSGKLHSSTGKARINDDVLLARAPFSPSRP